MDLLYFPLSEVEKDYGQHRTFITSPKNPKPVRNENNDKSYFTQNSHKMCHGIEAIIIVRKNKKIRQMTK